MTRKHPRESTLPLSEIDVIILYCTLYSSGHTVPKYSEKLLTPRVLSPEKNAHALEFVLDKLYFCVPRLGPGN